MSGESEEDEALPSATDSQFTRRGFLRVAGISASAALLDACTPKCHPQWERVSHANDEWHDEELYRREDHLHLRIRFFDFVREGNRLRRLNKRLPLVVVLFPPQHVLERAYFSQTGNPQEPLALPVRDHRAGEFGNTRLVFEIDNSVQELPYNIQTMFAWGQLIETATATGSVDRRYKPRLVPPNPQPRAPAGLDGLTETAIEMPVHLVLNPAPDAAWVHASLPIRGKKGHVELWSTQVAPRTFNGRLRPGSVDGFAVWSDDYPGYNWEKPDTSKLPAGAETYRTTLTPLATESEIPWKTLEVRGDLVDKTMGAGPAPNQQRGAQPFKFDQLALSSLGGWMNVRGDWSPGPQLPALELWRHVITGGRDQYARVQKRVYLFPYGHLAAEVSETQREFEETAQAPIAPLRQHNFIAIRERERDYRDAAYGETVVHSTPHPIIRFLTERSPDLPPNAKRTTGLPAGTYVPLLANNRPVLFELQGVDHNGHTQAFYSPVIVVENLNVRTFSQSELDQLNIAFKQAVIDAKPPPLDGVPIAFTPTAALKGAGDVDSHLLTQSLTYVGKTTSPPPFFAPVLESARVRHRALQHMMRESAEVEITYLEDYKKFGFDQQYNHAKLGAFAQVLDPGKWIDFAPPNAAGESLQLVTPNMSIKTFSATAGPLSIDASKLLADIDFGDFFGGFGGAARSVGRILGGIKLGSIIAKLDAKDVKLSTPGTHLPKLTMIPYKDGGHCVHYTWSTGRLQGDPTGTFLAYNEVERKKQPASLKVSAKVCATKTAQVVERTVTATLSNFTLAFLGSNPFLKLRFNSITVTKTAGAPDQVDVKFAGVEFDGALKFIDDLAKAAAGLISRGNRLPIRLVGTDLQVRYPIRLPSVSAGAFSIENVAFVVGADIPLDGEPIKVLLGFAERANPFLMSASLLGGGGWLAMRFRTDLASGALVDSVEGALELGGNLSLDLGYAKGRAYAFVGIYFRFEASKVTVGGYVRLGGALDILGLITISVEFFLGLNYDSGKNVLEGTARMTVCVEILFFSASVTLEITRCFKGSSSAVCSLLGVSEEDDVAMDWPTYWEAFA